jgi:hypothetical protein
MLEKLSKPAPYWKAPDTLLPRVLAAVEQSQPLIIPTPVSVVGIAVTAILCALTGVGIAVGFGVIPLPSGTTLIDLTLTGLHVLVVAERLATDLLTASLHNRFLFFAMLVYATIMVPAGLAGMRAILYFVTISPQSRRSPV